MDKVCTQCSASFEMSDADRAHRTKFTPTFGGKQFLLPEPELCFQCRLRRRLSFYNCRSLYKRTCSLTNQSIVSIYSPDKPYTVYEKAIWFGDKWDPLDYGKDVDFSRPFLPQVRELANRVPLFSIAHFGTDNINSDYTNDNYKLKNCYWTFDGEQAQDCYYLNTFVKDQNCMDGVFIEDCELCYECIHCKGCYNLRYSRYCNTCSGSWFLRDCIGCKNCFGCANLRQKQYCIWNEQKSKEEYEKFLAAFQSNSHVEIANMREKAETFFRTKPVKALRGELNVESTGDNIYQSKKSHWCFDCNLQEECRYCSNCLMSAKDDMDVHTWGDGVELCYDSCVVGANVRNLLFDYYVTQQSENIYYSLYCSYGCRNCFGCVSMRRKEHCILNKQYSKEEYEQLARKITEHMHETGEWGSFFPTELSLFGYNETVAQVFFPMKKEEVLKHGWQWCDYEAPVEATKTIQAQQLPDDQKVVPDDVLNWAIVCEVTGKPFKIIRQELDFYRQHNLPLPRRHPNRRHADRYAYKNPFRLWKRTCAKCAKAIETTYAPNRKEIVYCEECYLKEVY